jgi:multiple sugar transport system substrate-binding protein
VRRLICEGATLRAALLALLCLAAGCSAPSSQTVELTWAVGKDSTGTQRRLADAFMAQNPGWTVRLIEMPASATVQRDSYVTYFIARDPTIDVYSIDLTWTAEFAAAGWLRPLDAEFPPAAHAAFLPGPIEGCTYGGHVYAVPWFTDAGLLYYRRDLLARERLTPPRTWEELVRQARLLGTKYRMYGFVFQAEQYEGLVCNFLEYVWSAGGTVAAPAITLDTPAARRALQFMYEMIHGLRVAPPAVLTFKEEESRQAFTAGQSVFLRNWPYVWLAAQDPANSTVAGRLGVMALPGRVPGAGVSCLGGWNLAVSRFSRHPGPAWRLIAFMTDPAAQRQFATGAGRLPTRHTLYRDRAVAAALPYLAAVYPALRTARPRPVSPYYARISDVLQVELHRALTDRQSVAAALRAAQRKIEALENGDRRFSGAGVR